MRSVKRIVAFILACVTVGLCLCACSTKGKPLMKLDKSELSVNHFELYLSRMKGMLSTTSYFGASAKKPEFWDTWMDITDKTTYNTHYTNMVLEAAKGYLAAVALFDERGLKLPKSYIDDIDANMEELVNNEANGSKTAFNAIIGEYGVNYEMLREAYIVEAKIDYLQDDLFGVNGSKVGPNLIDKYYKDNYVRFKQVFLYSYELLYETDANGDVVYYKEDGRISYDNTKTAKTDESGSYVVDKNGDRVFVYTDEDGKERIAYKRENASRLNLTDEDGEPLIREYNSTEMEVLTEQANEILAQTKKNDTVTFDSLVTKYSEDAGLSDYPNGYYLTESVNYESPELREAIFGMDIGDVKMVKTKYGIHIVMRYELEEGAYASTEYEDLFISTKTGTYLFMDDLIGELFTEYLAPYKKKVVVDEKLLEKVDIKNAAINYYY